MGTNSSDAAMTQILAQHNSVVNTQAITETNYFTPTVSGTYYLGFKYSVNSGALNMFMDDISVNVAPTCPSPINLAVSNVTNNSATISFTANPTSPTGGYDYYFSTSNTPPNGTSTPNGNTTVTSFQLNSLAANTMYYLWMRANCSGTPGGWTTNPVTFTTACNAVNIPYVQQFEGATPPPPFHLAPVLKICLAQMHGLLRLILMLMGLLLQMGRF